MHSRRYLSIPCLPARRQGCPEWSPFDAAALAPHRRQPPRSVDAVSRLRATGPRTPERQYSSSPCHRQRDSPNLFASPRYRKVYPLLAERRRTWPARCIRAQNIARIQLHGVPFGTFPSFLSPVGKEGSRHCTDHNFHIPDRTPPNACQYRISCPDSGGCPLDGLPKRLAAVQSVALCCTAAMTNDRDPSAPAARYSHKDAHAPEKNARRKALQEQWLRSLDCHVNRCTGR